MLSTATLIYSDPEFTYLDTRGETIFLIQFAKCRIDASAPNLDRMVSQFAGLDGQPCQANQPYLD
jgi:hypothetical protein